MTVTESRLKRGKREEGGWGDTEIPEPSINQSDSSAKKKKKRKSAMKVMVSRSKRLFRSSDVSTVTTVAFWNERALMDSLIQSSERHAKIIQLTSLSILLLCVRIMICVGGHMFGIYEHFAGIFLYGDLFFPPLTQGLYLLFSVFQICLLGAIVVQTLFLCCAVTCLSELFVVLFWPRWCKVGGFGVYHALLPSTSHSEPHRHWLGTLHPWSPRVSVEQYFKVEVCGVSVE